MQHSFPTLVLSKPDALQTEMDALKRLQAETAAELNVLLPALLDRAFKKKCECERAKQS